MRHKVIALFWHIGVVTFVLATGVKAQTPPDVEASVIPIPMLCMERADAMVAINEHNETNTARGMTGPILVQVWSAPSGKFTITLRHPDAPGKLCGLLAGEYWHEVSE